MVIHSPLPSIDIPQVGLVQFLFSNINNVPEDRELLIDAETGKSLTFAAIKDNILRFAAGLQDKCQFKKGDVIAIFSPNQYDYPIPLLGTIAAGGSTTTANPSYTTRELCHQLETTKAKVIIAHESNIKIAKEAANKVGISHIFVFGDEAVDGIVPFTQALFSDRRIILEEITPEEAKETVTYLCFSSGTTGKSKGVMTTHTNIIANICQYTALDGKHLNGKHDRIIAAAPLFHIMGLVLMAHVPIYLGVPVYVMTRFSLPQFLETVQNRKITYTVVAPPVILLLAKDPIVNNYDLSSLRLIVSGAAPLGAEISTQAKQRVPTMVVKQGYGTTETSACVFIQPTERIINGSAGILLPNMVVKIVDEEGKEVKQGERGELLVKGPNVMKGYINNPEATAACLDAEGYYHTGDVTVQDENGHFFIVDRIKELIKYKGFQVPPAELEALLLKSDIIADCAVIGVYDPQQATEIPQGCIVLKPGVPATKETAESIKKYIAGLVVYYKQIRRITFVREIPKNPSGKILRRILRESIKTEAPKARL
ncbi:hypothetical protein G6F46_005763 [Rhizopus delemar]|uniref:Acetyl-CoA synthetase-like protein n=3 Tax=Rhizopus TaxID=4842 RepID=I1BQR0_RHIO9|nr:hypothetical protein RO3G_03244 [Rhizopus delemar RA 99-880]KAG1498444.1 hypothetical protein G6F54_005076 [Rhizopus delemar]KAG1544811.1 hypothetical protein G6F51_005832 [Rhizopus arrhizus]KAG1512212.1 hypothetical protein G6F53_005350 [Rhizopus delemar]KAG1560405.1 hypothetical protein G6F49_002722 [Rhizopus delemar]|eukprot:EIE78540.1 hypothetical protein RO3G_03244 [Rhizopus delemar RA 99-880]